MDDKQRLNLQEMIKAYDADDNTSKIRDLKHSRRIRDDVEKFVGERRINLLKESGIKFQHNIEIGKNFTLEELKEKHNEANSNVIRLSDIKLLLPSDKFSFEENGLFLFQWEHIKDLIDLKDFRL